MQSPVIYRTSPHGDATLFRRARPIVAKDITRPCCHESASGPEGLRATNHSGLGRRTRRASGGAQAFSEASLTCHDNDLLLEWGVHLSRLKNRPVDRVVSVINNLPGESACRATQESASHRRSRSPCHPQIAGKVWQPLCV